jgi:hypothetical protein
MGRHHQLTGVVAENQNQVKGIAIHCRGLCIKLFMKLLLQKVTAELYIHPEDRFHKNSLTRASQIQQQQ